MLYNYRHIFKKSGGVHDLVMGLSKLLSSIHLGHTNISDNPVNTKLREISASESDSIQIYGTWSWPWEPLAEPVECNFCAVVAAAAKMPVSLVKLLLTNEWW